MAELLSCGESLVRLLEQHSVDAVFGIPGTHTLELYRGLARSSIRHIQPRHEQGAGFMADGYARASGRPGVCFLIAGPGLLNAATAIAQAFSDSIPMLVVSSVGSPPASGVPEGHIHELPNQAETMRGLTAFSGTAAVPQDLPDLVETCFSRLRSGRARPVHIALPVDLMEQAAAPCEGSPRGDAAGTIGRDFGRELTQAAALFSRAEQPVVILGGGAVDCGPAAVALAERIGAAILTTIAGKGLVTDDHPLHAGAALTTAVGRRLAEEADVVLVLGSELAASDTGEAAVLFRQADPPRRRRRRAPLASACLSSLADGSGMRGWTPWPCSVPGPSQRMAAPPPIAGRNPGARPQLCEPPSQGPGGAAPGDTGRRHSRGRYGAAAYTANVAFRCSRPRSYFYPVGLSTMGYALPAAIGAKIAAPDRAAIALTGDGGFLFTAAELGTAVELGLSIVVLLWNNDGLGQIRDRMTTRGISPIGVNPRNPDFLALARAFGCRTARPASVAGLKREIRAALRRHLPTVIEIHEDGAWLDG
jgi:5-guanidino-2-oxopentanoate decarboxylase